MKSCDDKKDVHNLDYAKHDLMLCSAPGLFRSLEKSLRKCTKLKVSYTYGDESIEFTGPDQLGVTELRVLQGLVALSGPHGKPIGPDPNTEIGKILRSEMALTGSASTEKIIGVTAQGYGNLASEIGYAVAKNGGGAIYDSIKNAIKRLMTVTIFIKKGKKEAGFHLISYYHSDNNSNNLNFALNPRLSGGILRKKQFAFLSMTEARALKTDAARILHQKLSWINYGCTRKVTLKVLRDMIYVDDSFEHEDMNDLSSEERKKAHESRLALLRKRMQTTRIAIRELQNLGWIFSEYKPKKFEITKPEMKLEAEK